jgi:hypothetical protein
MERTHGTSVPRRQFYDVAVEFVTQLLRQHHEISQTAQFHVSGRPVRRVGVTIANENIFSGE